MDVDGNLVSSGLATGENTARDVWESLQWSQKVAGRALGVLPLSTSIACTLGAQRVSC